MKKRSALKNGGDWLFNKESTNLYKPTKPWIFCKWSKRSKRVCRPRRRYAVVLLNKTSITFDQRCASQYGTRSRNFIATNTKLEVPTSIKNGNKRLTLINDMLKSINTKRYGYKSLFNNLLCSKKEKRPFVNVLKPSIARLLCDFEAERIVSKRSNGMIGQKLSMSRRSEELRRVKNYHSLMDHSCTPQRQGLIGNKITRRHTQSNKVSSKWKSDKKSLKAVLCAKSMEIQRGKCERPVTTFELRSFKL